MSKNTKKIALIIFAVLFFFNILAWTVVFDLSRPQFLEVHFFDVGQGDAIFIETPQKHQILIDGGPSSKILEKLGKEMPFYDRSIDLIILTHPERDHLAGLIEVLKKYKIENILWTGIVRDIVEYDEWQKLIKEERAKIFIAQAGQKIYCLTPDVKHCYFDILHPFENLEGREFKDSNNTSIVSRLNFDESSFLFTGDVYKSVERKLLEKEIELETDVLKVGHHGSKTSTSEEFLQIVLPEIAVIQVGQNQYGHPHPEVLERLENFDINVLRTDRAGDIKIISDGKNLKIK